mgnify:FL=1
MKKNMSTFIFILLIAGIASLVLFHKPKNHSEAELIKWFSSKLSDISIRLEDDIEKDKKGEYAHTGKQSFDKRGTIIYVLHDKNYARFDVSDKNNLSVKDIMNTKGYKKLYKKTRELNLSIRLEEKDVEGDGVDKLDSLDEYVDDFPLYYTVEISGW